MPGHPPRPDTLGGGARRRASERAPHGTPSGSGESPPLQATLTSNSDTGDPWGRGCAPEGPCARHPPKTLICLSSIPRCPRAWHCGRATPVTPICVSASQGRVFASAGTLRLGSEPSHSGGTRDAEPEACSRHPAAGHSGFLDRQWVLTWQTRWPARGHDNGPVFLPHAFLQPLSARALRRRLNRQKHSGAPDGSPVALPSAQAEVGGPLITPSLPPRGRTMLLFPEGFRPLLSSSSDEASGERDSVPTPLSFSTTSSLHPPGAGSTGRGRSSPPGRRSRSQKRLVSPGQISLH